MMPAIRWGLLLALMLCAWTMLLHVTGVYSVRLQYASIADTVAIVFPLLAITMAMLQRRRMQSNSLTMREGFTTGVATMLISWPPTAAFMLVYHHVIHPEWLDRLMAFERQKMTAAGTSAAEIATVMDRMGARASVRTELVSSLIGTILFAIVMSALIALVLRRRGGTRELASRRAA